MDILNLVVMVHICVLIILVILLIIGISKIRSQRKTIEQLNEESASILNDNRILKNDLAEAQRNDARDPKTGRYTGGKK